MWVLEIIAIVIFAAAAAVVFIIVIADCTSLPPIRHRRRHVATAATAIACCYCRCCRCHHRHRRLFRCSFQFIVGYVAVAETVAIAASTISSAAAIS
jgi:hypothetical protein